MKVWQENYGADADGNRGVLTTFWELEYTEQEQSEIAELLGALGCTSEDSGLQEIEYEDQTIEVDISEYSEDLKQIEDDFIKGRIERDNLNLCKFDEIKTIYKSPRDFYRPADKSLEEIEVDILHNGYVPVPF